MANPLDILNEYKVKLGKLKDKVVDFFDGDNETVPKFLTSDEVKTSFGEDLPNSDYMLKVNPDKTASFITPANYEVTSNQDVFSPDGMKVDVNQMPDIKGVFGNVYTDTEVDSLRGYIQSDPTSFLKELDTVGRTPESESLMRKIFDGINDDQMGWLFGEMTPSAKLLARNSASVQAVDAKPVTEEPGFLGKAWNWANAPVGDANKVDAGTPPVFDEFLAQFYRENNAPAVLQKKLFDLTPNEENERAAIEGDWQRRAKVAYDQMYGQGESGKAVARAIPKKVGEATMLGYGAGSVISKGLEPSQGLGTVTPMDIGFAALDVAAILGIGAKPATAAAKQAVKEIKPIAKELAASEVGAVKLGKGVPEEPIKPPVEATSNEPLNNFIKNASEEELNIERRASQEIVNNMTATPEYKKLNQDIIQSIDNELKIRATSAQKGTEIPKQAAPEKPVVETPAKGGAIPPSEPPVEPPITTVPQPSGKSKSILGNLQDADELVTIMSKPDAFRKIANLPGVRKVMSVFSPAGVADTVPKWGSIARAALREEGNYKAIGAFSKLEAVGDKVKIWGKLDNTQTLTQGKLKGKTLDEVLTYRNKYAPDMTPQQKQFADTFRELEDAKLDLLKRNDIEINELTFEEGGEYIGRRIAGKIDPRTGEIAESAFIGSPGPGRPGAKMGAEKTRYFKDINEAVKAGYRYLPPDEALFLNLKGAYNRIADKQVSEWVLDRVPWRTSGVSESLITAKDLAKSNLTTGLRLKNLLNRAVRGERVPIDETLTKTYPKEAQELKDLIPFLQQDAPVADRVQKLTARIEEIIGKNKTAYRSARDTVLDAHDRALQAHYDEARVNAPAFSGKVFTGPEAKQTAEILNKSFNSQYGDLDRIINGVNKANSIGRYFALAGDASPLLIQLITFPFRYPVVWAKSGINFTKALFSTTSHAAYLAKNNEIIQKSRNLILSKGGQTEYTEAFRTGGIMQSKAVAPAKAVLEPFQRGFESAMDTAGIELRKAYNYMANTPQKAAEIEQFINEIRGVTSSARIGVSPSVRSLETAAFLAPRYNRATFALLSDIANGGIRGNEARKALTALIGGVTATATAVTLARGEGWEGVKKHLDPRNPSQFLTWEIAGQRIGPGSKIRSLTVLLGKIINKPEQTVNYVNSFIRGNFSPVASTGYDILMGSDYIGEPTRPGRGSYGQITGMKEGMIGLSKRVFAENLLPIWLQSTLLEGGDLEGKAVRGTAEFFGGRAYNLEQSQIYKDKWSDVLKPYSDISSDDPDAQSKRTALRTSQPDTEAKLFITGDISSVSTMSAVNSVVKLIQENELDTKEINAIANYKGVGKEIDRTDILMAQINDKMTPELQYKSNQFTLNDKWKTYDQAYAAVGDKNSQYYIEDVNARKEKQASILTKYPEYAEARYRMDAYSHNIPETYHDQYVEYAMLPDSGTGSTTKKHDWLLSHPEYYKDVWLGLLGNKPVATTASVAK